MKWNIFGSFLRPNGKAILYSGNPQWWVGPIQFAFLPWSTCERDRETNCSGDVVVKIDYNGKIRCDNTNTERVIEQHGPGTINDNGEISDFAPGTSCSSGALSFPTRSVSNSHGDRLTQEWRTTLITSQSIVDGKADFRSQSKERSRCGLLPSSSRSTTSAGCCEKMKKSKEALFAGTLKMAEKKTNIAELGWPFWCLTLKRQRGTWTTTGKIIRKCHNKWGTPGESWEWKEGEDYLDNIRRMTISESRN